MAKKQEIIRCVVCDSDHLTNYRKTTHCNVCRAYRDMTFLGGKTYSCFACSGTFAQLSRNDEMCTNCDWKHPIYGEGICGFCKKDELPLMRKDILICIGCARNPKRRPKVLLALAAKQRQLIANPVRLDPLPVEPEPEAIQDDDVPEV